MFHIQIIHCVKKHFGRYGIPKVIVFYCGSQFISHDFSVFCKKWHITHITSSPEHQQENGRGKTAKHLLKQLPETMKINIWHFYN